MPILEELYRTLAVSDEPFTRRCPIDAMRATVRRGDYRSFADRLLTILAVVRAEGREMFAAGEQQYFDDLFGLWFKALADPSFRLGPGDEKFFSLNANLVNLLAVTSHKNGDDCLKKIAGQADNMAKLLLLYTPRSRLRIPIKPLFDADPALASLWYSSVWDWADTYVHPLVYENYRYFLENVDERFEAFDSNLACGFFYSTYVDEDKDRRLKRIFNKAVRRYASAARVENRPNPRSIAVVTAFWDGRHAVYRAFAPHLEEVARKYDLTLVNLSSGGVREADTSMFRRVSTIEANAARINLDAVANNDFQLVYFPDLGFRQESLYLANIRLAPIQCMGTGHPVSSAATQMDYFLSGSEVETPDRPELNYDERLVLMPGLSVHPVRPRYRPRNPPPAERFTINLPWMYMKNNFRTAGVLRRIHDAAKRPIRFAIFPGCAATRNSSHMAAIQDYANHLPRDSYTIHPSMKYEDYMAELELGRFAMHSYPFGGGTTAVDAFVLGKPLTALRGRHEYNRYAAALLARLGLEELVADTEDRWVEICARLINDDLYLADVTGRLREADLEKTLFSVPGVDNLRRAFDHLIEHDADLRRDGSREPIAIT